MSPKIFIPVTITLTETEYLIVEDLAKQLGLEDKQLSVAVRLIIREWRELSPPGTIRSPQSEPPVNG